MLYFITDGYNTKIGVSKKPLNRIKGLQTSNPNKLTFKYLFNVKDKYEKIIHKLLREYQTSSNNEWFNLNNIDLFKILKQLSIPELIDESQAIFKATNLNNMLDGSLRKQNHNNIPKEKLNNKSNIQELLNDIKNHLENKKKVRISYQVYMDRYNFTKEEISYYVKSARLSKLIFYHNSNI